MARRAVFLDRDGVLVEDSHLITSPSQVRLCPGAPEATGELRRAGFIVVVVSNQTVVARGMASEEDVLGTHEWIQHLLSQAGGGPIDRFYFCPHHPRATVPQYRVECECRKPRPGLLLRAASELDLDLAASYMVGDRISDVAAGRKAGCTTVLVESGMKSAPLIESPEDYASVEPDVVCAGLAEAATWILGHSKERRRSDDSRREVEGAPAMPRKGVQAGP